MNTMILASIFSPAELAVIIVVAAIVLLLTVGNFVLFYLLRKHQEHKLCTTKLQAKRNELLDRLKNISDDGTLVSGGMIYSDGDEGGDEDDDEDDANEPDVATQTVGDDEDITQNEILAVADMSEYTRRKLGCVGEEYDNKRYYVRYTYGFEARLRAASEEVKERYVEFVNELFLYKDVKIKSSFRGQRFYTGNKTLGHIFMRGKTLCVCFALDPAEYAETKYRGIDISDKKRYAKTPLMYKLTSMRRVEYARYLIVQLAERNRIVPDDAEPTKLNKLLSLTPDELFVAQALKIAILGEAPELETEAEPEINVDEQDVAISEAEEGTNDEQDELAVQTPEGKIVFDRSFTARIIQGDDALKARYSELKNYLLAFRGMHCRMSWKRETFAIGKNTIATFAVRGKTLMLYLATDPHKFDRTKYKVENMSEVASRRKTPLLFRIKSDLRTAYAKQLIDMVLDENGVPRIERKPQDYTVPYKSTDTLVKRGLIRITTQSGSGYPRGKQE